MPFPTARTYVGIAKEATPGTPIAPTMTIPLKTFQPEDLLQMLADMGVRGSMTDEYGDVPGPSWGAYSLGGDAFPDSLPWFVASMCPDVATTGAGNPFTHTEGLLNTGSGQPKGYTLTDYNAITPTSGARRYPGATFSDLTLKYNAAGLLEWDAKCLTYPSSAFPTSAPTKTFGTLVPTPVYLAAFTVGGGVITNVEDGTLVMKRTVVPIHTGDGTNSPYALFSGPLHVNGTLTCVAEDETELTRYLTNTQPSIDLNWLATVNASTQINAHMSKVAYKPGVVIDRGKDYVVVKVVYDAIANVTDATASGGFSPIKWTFQNSLPAATYA